MSERDGFHIVNKIYHHGIQNKNKLGTSNLNKIPFFCYSVYSKGKGWL
jgi:hypothetical protein